MTTLSRRSMRVTWIDWDRKIKRENFSGFMFHNSYSCFPQVRPWQFPFGLFKGEREERARKENYFASIFGQSWQSRLSCLSSCLDLSFSGNIQQWLSSQQSGVTSQTKYKLSISVYLTVSQLWVVQLARIHCQSTILSWSWWWLGEGGRASVSRTLVKNFPH